MTPDHKRLGDLLVDENIITPQDLADAIAEQRRSGELLGSTLVRMGLVSESQLVKVLQLQLGLPLVDLAEIVADERALSLIREDLARKYSALPLEVEDRRTLVVAMADPLNVAALEDLRFHSGLVVRPVIAMPSAIHDAIDRYYHMDTSMTGVIDGILASDDQTVVPSAGEDDVQAQGIEELVGEAEGKPVVRLTNWLLARAVTERATDVHIEPQARDVTVRLRIDGLLHPVQRLPKWTQGAIASRIKVLAGLDIAEKRQPQDGRLSAVIRNRRVNMRVSTLSTTHGEKVVVRIVDTLRAGIELGDLGLLRDDRAQVGRLLDRPQGIVLVTGPAGSGKSTLLYAALRHLQHETRNIVTVEDPVELQIPGVNQVQVSERTRKTYPTALRAVLRQDPNVIMIGEIRDRETAQIAFRASATGRLVLASVHATDAAGAVTRLLDLGLEPFVVSASLQGVVSLRLVRTLCPRCREDYEVNASNLNRLGVRDLGQGTVRLGRGRGCAHCRHTGYHGRTGIFEVLEINDALRPLVGAGAPEATIRQAAVENGMRTIGEDGLKKVLTGLTTLDEVTRVVYLAESGVKMCASCASVLAREYEYCPHCGDFVGEHCEHCRRRLDPRWGFCPYCGRESARPGRGGERRTPPVKGAPLPDREDEGLLKAG